MTWFAIANSRIQSLCWRCVSIGATAVHIPTRFGHKNQINKPLGRASQPDWMIEFHIFIDWFRLISQCALVDFVAFYVCYYLFVCLAACSTVFMWLWPGTHISFLCRYDTIWLYEFVGNEIVAHAKLTGNSNWTAIACSFIRLCGSTFVFMAKQRSEELLISLFMWRPMQCSNMLLLLCGTRFVCAQSAFTFFVNSKKENKSERNVMKWNGSKWREMPVPIWIASISLEYMIKLESKCCSPLHFTSKIKWVVQFSFYRRHRCRYCFLFRLHFFVVLLHSLSRSLHPYRSFSYWSKTKDLWFHSIYKTPMKLNPHMHAATYNSRNTMYSCEWCPRNWKTKTHCAVLLVHLQCNPMHTDISASARDEWRQNKRNGKGKRQHQWSPSN